MPNPATSLPQIHPDARVVDPILWTVLYFDVFGHPLTRREVTRLVRPEDPRAVDRACDHLVLRGHLGAHGPHVFVPGNERGVVRRRAGGRRAERSWPAARRAAAVLARCPFVHGVLVTGGMSKGSVGPDADIDFLLLVEPGRVWLVKSLLQVWRKSLPKRARECFCTNYLLATDALEIPEKNVFTAIELATAVPMYGEACATLLRENEWASQWVPGLPWSIRRAENAPPVHRAIGRRAVERIGRFGADDLEERALAWWTRYWDRKYAWMEDGVRAKRFKRRPEVATNHLNDFQDWVLTEWRNRLAAHGVPEPT